MPIIDLQRRLVEVGRIRMGERNAKGYPTRLATWKLTSRDKIRLDAAAQAYGGTVIPWDGHDGQYALVTETDALPILLMPGQTLSSWYELWSGGGCKRRCDGQIEQLTDGPCLCDPEARECKPHTRLNVLLPDVAGLGCWRLDTSGYYAAVELAGTVDLLEIATARGALLPARLRIDQRVQIKEGQTKRFPVPTLDIDVRVPEMLAITRQTPDAVADPRLELPAGYTPMPQRANGVTVSEGLAAANKGAQPAARNARSAAPIGDTAEFVVDEPVPVDDATLPTGSAKPSITKKQKDILNMLVGQLRDTGGHITTEQLWLAVERTPQVSEDGLLHWSPLRDSLTRLEASRLVDQLETFAAIVGSSTSAPATPSAAGDSGPVGALVEELLQLAPAEKRDMVEAAIRKNKEAHAMSPLAHKQWLEQQLVKAKEKAAA